MAIIAYYTTALAIDATIPLPVKKDPNLGVTTVYSLAVANVVSGDLLDITGKVQVTNNLHKAPYLATNNNVSVGTCLAYLDGQGALQTITFWTGGNVNATGHHEPRGEATTWQVPQGVSGTVTVCFLAKSAALQAKSNWALRVDQGYGNLRIKHERI